MTDDFPHAALTPLANHRPTRQALATLQRELTANAMSVPSIRGDGLSGHYALVTTAATYLTDTGADFVAPTNPGTKPVHPAAATSAQITEGNRQYTADVTEFRLYATTEARLKRLLLEAVPDTFTAKKAHAKFGYAKVTTLALITHLVDTYGTITPDDLALNLTTMNKVWTSNQPIEDLFSQLRIAQIFAEDEEPIPDSFAIRSALTNLANTGLYTDAIRDWRKLPAADQTLDRFETDFAFAYDERKQHATTTNAGYHHAAAVTSTKAPTAPTPPRSPVAPTATPSFYCWSHGLGRNPVHTSATCTNPCPGHRLDATLDNMLGGCPMVQTRRGEKTIWQRPARPAPAAPPAPR